MKRGAPQFRDSDAALLRIWQPGHTAVDEKNKDYMRLFRMGLVVGAVDNSHPSGPRGVIRVTAAGERKLAESTALAHVAKL